MNEKELVQIIGNGATPYAMITSLMAAASAKDSQLTAEEKAERKEKRRLLAEQRSRQAKIHKSICPDCDSKLARGKKDKKNGYKRSWVCKSCDNTHSL